MSQAPSTPTKDTADTMSHDLGFSMTELLVKVYSQNGYTIKELPNGCACLWLPLLEPYADPQLAKAADKMRASHRDLLIPTKGGHLLPIDKVAKRAGADQDFMSVLEEVNRSQ